jgi:putative ABC transport system permease protein
VSLDRSRAELIGVAGQLEQQYPDANRQLSAVVTPLHETIVGPVKPALLILLSAVGCVLLIACANVGGLMLVRATARSREVSIRMALGADRMRLARQLLTESVVLAAAGGAVGLFVCAWSLGVLVRIAPAGIPRIDHVRIDSAVVAFTFAIAIAAGLIFGLAPALHVRGRNPQESLRSAGRGAIGGSHQTARHVLVVAEMALSLVLAIGAALLIKSFILVQRVDAGFHTTSIVTIDRIELPRQRASAAASAAFFDQLLTKIRAIPGVEEAGATLGLPLDPRAGFFVDESPFTIAGQAALPRAQRPSAPLHVITPGFFSAIDVPLRRGRLFDERDASRSPAVIIINETMARRFWPAQDPIGQRITHELSIVPGQSSTREIVGVVGDVRHFGLEQASDAQMYIPHGQMPWPSMAVVVRSSLNRQQIGEPIRRAVWSIDPTIPVPPLRTLDDVVADAVGQPRFRAWLLGLFAAIAVLLASIGLYGTMAYAVQQRTREIGLRMALGATPSQAGALLLRGGIKLVLAGTALGVAAAAVVTRVLSSLLYGVVATDLTTFVVFPLGLAAIGLLACYLPTLAARRIDPIHAINSDL